MKCKQLYILSFILFLSLDIVAQIQQLKFNKIAGSNGISLGKINAITQDSYGFMWFSDQTNGCLVRYDGNHMTKFQNDPEDPNTLGGNYPECLVSDSSGIIWIGFGGSGIDRYDPLTDTFAHFRNDPNDSESLNSDYINAIHIDHLGILWVGTSDGLDRLDPKTGKFYHYTNDINNSKSLSNNVVRVIYEDREGTLWIGTGFPWISDNTGGLNRFDRGTNTFTKYMNDKDNVNSLVNNKIRAILEDSNGNFWIGTGMDGLHTMDRKTGKITRHSYDPKHPEKLSRPPLNHKYDHITFITEDADENLWIGTQSNGINRYDPATQKISHYGNNADSSGAFYDNSGWWAHATSDGLVWVSTQESNLYKIDLYNKNIPHVDIDGGVRDFYEESPSSLWMATSRGLVRKDLQTGTSQRFIHEPQNTNSLSDSFIWGIIKDYKGTFWLGTAQGINLYNPTSGLFNRYLYKTNETSSFGEYYSVIYEDQDLNLWLGNSGGGLNLLDRKTGDFIPFQNDTTNPNSIINDKVTAILEDGNDGFWIGVDRHSGVFRMNKKTREFKRYIQGHSVTDMYIDSDGIIWVGTQDGMFHYDYSSNKFYSIREEDTGIRQNSYVLSIIGDNEDNLWISTLDGIYKLNKSRDQFIHFGKESGVFIKDDDRFFAGSAFKSQNGKIYIGNPLGYYSIYPMSSNSISGETELYFTSFWLNNRSIKPGLDGTLRESLYDTKEIQLNHDQNAFSISFTAIDFRSSEDRIIYYTLENYDTDWRQTLPENLVNYVKVPPGNYTFRIKAVNSANGEWTERSMNLIIIPPWWNTPLAYALYSLFFIGGVFMVDRIQRRRILEKERTKAKEKELEHAREIKKAYTDLKATQSQLIQSEKMASLGELTAGIAHEIQNPLNFVNNFSEVSRELIAEMKEELDKGDIVEAKEVAADIDQNLKKINHHGQRASGIVKGMLEHSRTGEGVKELTDINNLADEYLRLAYHGLRAKDKSFNADFKTDFDEALPKIKVVPQDFGRVLLNLINNAFYVVDKKSKEGIDGYKPEVLVSTKTHDNSMEIIVSDNGGGIPEQVRDKIFQPFFTTKPTGSGTGLGLSLSYDIVKAHGGELKVETKKNEGSEFIIVLGINTN